MSRYRVMVATKEFDKPYSMVIREAPALVWNGSSLQDGYFSNFLLEFQRAPRSGQDGIRDMFHPPLDSSSPTMFSLIVVSTRLAATWSDAYSVGFIYKLLAIVSTNAHEYYGFVNSTSTGNLREHETIGAPSRRSRAALFITGSKIQHSCDPNVFHTSQTNDGALEYKAIRPIKAGEPISFSYLTGEYETATDDSSTCSAPRPFDVAANDAAVQIRTGSAFCPVCEIIRPCAPDAPEESWACPECGVQERVTRAEALLVATYQNSREKRAEAPTSPHYTLIREVNQQLSHVHWIGIRSWKELTTLYASKSALLDKLPFLAHDGVSEGLSKDQLRQLSAISGIRSVLLTECVSSNCGGCPPGVYKHNPNFSCASSMFHVSVDLMEIPASMHLPFAKEMIRRYIPVMRGRFGEQDTDVAAIERHLVSQKVASHHECCFCGSACAQLKTCARCKMAWYCKKDCQVKHWKKSHRVQYIEVPK